MTVVICLEIAGTKFVSLCDRVSNGIELLVVDTSFVDDRVDLPIDTLVVDLTREMIFEEDWVAVVNL